jgi:hypothetical protein
MKIVVVGGSGLDGEVGRVDVPLALAVQSERRYG